MSILPNTFNLNPPPGFRGLHPGLPVRMYHRHLPHWRQAGATYFVTFRLNDALPQEQLNQLKEHRRRWEVSNPVPRTEEDWANYAREITQRAERWMDEGFGACYFRESTNAELMANALRYYRNSRCDVSCLIVMPNHVHAVMKPLGDCELEVVLKIMKGFVSREINKQLGTTGSIWEQESYDRIIRDEEHLYRVVQYIGSNGRRAGLSPSEFYRWIDPQWQQAGWDFVDDAIR